VGGMPERQMRNVGVSCALKDNGGVGNRVAGTLRACHAGIDICVVRARCLVLVDPPPSPSSTLHARSITSHHAGSTALAQW
jgi:hypothetical protein